MSMLTPFFGSLSLTCCAERVQSKQGCCLEVVTGQRQALRIKFAEARTKVEGRTTSQVCRHPSSEACLLLVALSGCSHCKCVASRWLPDKGFRGLQPSFHFPFKDSLILVGAGYSGWCTRTTFYIIIPLSI